MTIETKPSLGLFEGEPIQQIPIPMEEISQDLENYGATRLSEKQLWRQRHWWTPIGPTVRATGLNLSLIHI